MVDSDYVIRHVEHSPRGLVTYHVTDLYGQRLHVSIPPGHNAGEHPDKAIRRALERHRPPRPAP